MSRGPRRHTTRPPLGSRHQPWQADGEDDVCDRCGGAIRWAWTERNNKMPIDRDEADRDDEAANQAVWRNQLRRLCVRTITAERPLLGFEHRAMPHFATCPPLVAEREAKKAARERAAALSANPLEEHP